MCPITIGSLYISIIGCKPGTVNVFDSIPNNSVSSCLLSHEGANRTHTIYSVRKMISNSSLEQHGNSDCGVFAAALAAALCSGKDPTEINFKQHQLRTHLKNCLYTREQSHRFLQTQRKRTKAKRSILSTRAAFTAQK